MVQQFAPCIAAGALLLGCGTVGSGASGDASAVDAADADAPDARALAVDVAPDSAAPVGTLSGDDVMVDALGRIVVVGPLDGTVNFGAGPLASMGNGDLVVVKYDASGTLLWNQRFSAVPGQGGASVATDNSSNVVVATGFQGNSISAACCRAKV